MKIKTVCESTGLSDRTVRYYIEEGLIVPSYNENYLGRKTFDFSELDINELKNIAVLRKFEFTIEEIRTILKDAETSKLIILDVKNRTKATFLNCQEKLAALSQINPEQAYTVAQLAEELSKPALILPDHNEEHSSDIAKKAFTILKAAIISAIVWLPIIISLFVVIINISNYYYPVFNFEMIAAVAITFVPTIGVLIVSKTKISFKKIIKRMLLVICILCIPVSFALSCGIISSSETSDFQHYRNFDVTCLANRNVIFQDFFPTWPRYFENVKQDDSTYETVYSDAEYYYHYHRGLDYTYDIYTGWPLEETEYNEEIQRISELFNNVAENKIYNYKFSEMKKGDYYCLILYNGEEPFSSATDNYDYIIFAYNEELKTVRYICCASLENGAYQPYYLSLDW